jgi:hypothetical protein
MVGPCPYRHLSVLRLSSPIIQSGSSSSNNNNNNCYYYDSSSSTQCGALHTFLPPLLTADLPQAGRPAFTVSHLAVGVCDQHQLVVQLIIQFVKWRFMFLVGKSFFRHGFMAGCHCRSKNTTGMAGHNLVNNQQCICGSPGVGNIAGM